MRVSLKAPPPADATPTSFAPDPALDVVPSGDTGPVPAAPAANAIPLAAQSIVNATKAAASQGGAQFNSMHSTPPSPAPVIAANPNAPNQRAASHQPPSAQAPKKKASTVILNAICIILGLALVGLLVLMFLGG